VSPAHSLLRILAKAEELTEIFFQLWILNLLLHVLAQLLLDAVHLLDRWVDKISRLISIYLILLYNSTFLFNLNCVVLIFVNFDRRLN